MSICLTLFKKLEFVQESVLEFYNILKSIETFKAAILQPKYRCKKLYPINPNNIINNILVSLLYCAILMEMYRYMMCL